MQWPPAPQLLRSRKSVFTIPSDAHEPLLYDVFVHLIVLQLLCVSPSLKELFPSTQHLTYLPKSGIPINTDYETFFTHTQVFLWTIQMLTFL